MKALAVILLGIFVLASSTRQLLAEHASDSAIAALWLAGIVPGVILGFISLRKHHAGWTQRRR
ncbi:MAG: hypothetical protein JWR15_4236 [Prosthecobacter sp.]|nr:hypothetical protein [Prosthecobacter sp.]